MPIVSKEYMRTDIPAAERRRTTRIICGNLYSKLPISTHTPTIVLRIVSTVVTGGGEGEVVGVDGSWDGGSADVVARIVAVEAVALNSPDLKDGINAR